VDHISVELAEAALALKDQVGFVKAYLEQRGDGWHLRYVEIVAGAEAPPGWRPVRWEYNQHLFVAQQLSGDQVAAVLADTIGELCIGGCAAVVSALEPNIARERHPSRAHLGTTTVLPWPVLEYRLSLADTTPPRSSLGGDGTMLIGEDCPSFPYFWTAFDAFFRPGNALASSNNHPQPRDLGKLWAMQPRTWLNTVRVTVTAVEVQLGGDVLEDVRVELNGTGLFTSEISDPQGRVQLVMPDGLPDDAWLYVTQGRQWLDYRRLGVMATGQEDPARAGVEIEVPDDPDTELSALLSAGEGQRVEYKRQLPGKEADSKRKVLKTVAAFANGQGGTIVFGMDPDELTVTGISEDYKDVRDRLGQLIRGNVVPPAPSYEIRRATADHRQLILLEVQPSSGQPYGLQFQDRPVEFYVRRGSSTYPATQGEVQTLAAVAHPPWDTDPMRRSW
jgi:hypothetical protein